MSVRVVIGLKVFLEDNAQYLQPMLSNLRSETTYSDQYARDIHFICFDKRSQINHETYQLV